MPASTPRHRRLLSLAAATGIATVGLIGLSAPAHAADGNVKVWVCKYVRTPGGFELLKGGKNPIEVSANSVNNKGPVNVGDKFPDAQGFSVVVQVAGADPGTGACSTTPPPPPPGTRVRLAPPVRLVNPAHLAPVLRARVGTAAGCRSGSSAVGPC